MAAKKKKPDAVNKLKATTLPAVAPRVSNTASPVLKVSLLIAGVALVSYLVLRKK